MSEATSLTLWVFSEEIPTYHVSNRVVISRFWTEGNLAPAQFIFKTLSVSWNKTPHPAFH